MYSVSLHSFGTAASALAETVTDELAHAGLIVKRGSDASVPDTPAVVAFTEGGIELLSFIHERSRHGRALLLAVGRRDIEHVDTLCWSILKAGAVDVILCDERAGCGPRLASRIERWFAVEQLVDSPLVRENLVGVSGAWRSLMRRAVEVARYSDGAILLLGESGTGKELIARLVHALDPRPSKKDLVVLDCSTIVPELAGSEFFGHERGAFTGAVAARDAAFALADGGTLFLDEVGELPTHLQAQLLRVIQEGTFKRVGSSNWRKTSFRLICATNRDLQQEVAAGRFRADLYHRIAAWVVRIPPLRERRDDIIPLARHLLQGASGGEEAPELDAAVARYLVALEYRGNVRELRQLVQRIRHRHLGPGPITIGCVPAEDRPSFEEDAAPWPDLAFETGIQHALALGIGLKQISRSAAEIATALAVADASGNLQRAATRLGVSDRALQIRRAAARTNGNRPQ